MEHTFLLKVIHHPNFFNLFPYLSYVDLLALAYAVRPIAPSFGKRIPNIKTILDRQLKHFEINVESFWTSLQNAGGLLHGSFLLHCLLEPLGHMGIYSKIFTEQSDVDLLETAASLKKEICPSCLRRLYLTHFPKSKESQENMLKGLLGFRNLSYEKQIEALKKQAPQACTLQLPHIRRRHTETNTISSFLCHLGEIGPEPDENYLRFNYERRLVWNIKQLKFDQVTVRIRDPTLKWWLWQQSDFTFGKVCFDGQKLYIANRHALIKRESIFPNIPNDKLFMICWGRMFKAQEKGFKITTTDLQIKRQEALKEKAAEARKIRCQLKYTD